MLYAMGTLLVFSGVDSMIMWHSNGFVIGKNTIFHGGQAVAVALGELCFGGFTLVAAIRSHINQCKNKIDRDP